MIDKLYADAISVAGRFKPWPFSQAALKNAKKFESPKASPPMLAAIENYKNYLLENPPQSRDLIIRPHNWFGLAQRWKEWEPEGDQASRDKENGLGDSPDVDWGALSVACKKEATQRKLHARHKYFHNPASIYWALSSIAKGEEKGPATVERVLALALERAGRVK